MLVICYNYYIMYIYMDIQLKNEGFDEMRKKYKKFLKRNPQRALTKQFYNYYELFNKDFSIKAPKNLFEGVDIEGNPFGYNKPNVQAVVQQVEPPPAS